MSEALPFSDDELVQLSRAHDRDLTARERRRAEALLGSARGVAYLATLSEITGQLAHEDPELAAPPLDVMVERAVGHGPTVASRPRFIASPPRRSWGTVPVALAAAVLLLVAAAGVVRHAQTPPVLAAPSHRAPDDGPASAVATAKTTGSAGLFSGAAPAAADTSARGPVDLGSFSSLDDLAAAAGALNVDHHAASTTVSSRPGPPDDGADAAGTYAGVPLADCPTDLIPFATATVAGVKVAVVLSAAGAPMAVSAGACATLGSVPAP